MKIEPTLVIGEVVDIPFEVSRIFVSDNGMEYELKPVSMIENCDRWHNDITVLIDEETSRKL